MELDGNAYADNYKLNDGKSIKDFILDKLRLNDKRKNIVYKNLDTGEKVIISSNSAGKLASHYKYGEAYQKTIAHIPEIIKHMKFLEEMPAEKQDAKFGNYSYYITGINMDGNPYTVLSTVGHNENGIYYDQNVFEGTAQEALEKANITTEDDSKYSRLVKILEGLKKEVLDPSELHSGDNSQQASNSKYNKFSEKKQDLNEENEKKAENPQEPPKKRASKRS